MIKPIIIVLFSDYCFFQIGDLPGHYHFRHDDVDELNKEHNRDKTDRLLLEKEVCYLQDISRIIMHRNTAQIMVMVYCIFIFHSLETVAV